ncbi:hypothetical protein [Shinella sp. JR1-6]|uniref:hypothetical protein n=1 Tax=Shinella sp. JR1-6 TaxID=2527671 RepID=UPI00102D4B44|nr:hypothetical protein [Shinella sp. JR1-6]TAA54800.1 hypothetical protein EXZ48_25870 [Shinella sp. JR1-6]
MATIIRKEVRKRGFFGWVFLLIFIGFNLLMLLWIIAGLSAVGGAPAASDAENAGRAIGSAIGVGIIFFIWACGSIILGLLALVTRGRKTIIEETMA